MNRVFEFLGISTKGKLPRVLVGLTLIVCGTFLIHGTGGLILANMGAFPFTYGLFDW
ncbi:MAG: hypothetical protein ACHQQQ_13490 [Bacteroidota bacterium]